jgi:hypothetical protein
MLRRSTPLIALVGLIALLQPVSPAAANEIAAGRDISYPQCGGPAPALTAAFAVLGANGGHTFSTNPCLVPELRWAKRLAGPPAFYANTGDPIPARSRHWPLGQTTPYVCSAKAPDSVACSFDYGWNGAQQSFGVAARAAQVLHHVSAADARMRAANVDWWLDVETMNSWRTLDVGDNRAAQVRDVAAISGAADALWSIGVQQVGVYSTAYQWQLITGGSAVVGNFLPPLRTWVAGFNDYDDAVAGCNGSGFTGGAVVLTQYLGEDGFDNDVACS